MKKNQNNLNIIKLGLLGDSPVGKTCICNSYMNFEYNADTIATIGEDKFEKKFTLKNGKEIKLIIFDTDGHERARARVLRAIRGVQGIILVFDFTCRNSFINLDNWLSAIKENFNDDIVIVLFGSSIDIEKERWKVTIGEAKEYAKKNNLVFFETSARKNIGINEGFAYITNKAYLIAEKKIEEKKANIEKYIQKREKNLNKLLKYINF